MSAMKKQEISDPDRNSIAPVQSQIDEASSEPIQDDAVFGEIREGDTNYRNVSWLGTTALMIKTQIGLGVLSMPKVFDILGIVPGIILLLTIAGMTSWSNWMVGVFKLRHPSVYGIDDVGRMMFGRFGYELLGAAYTLYWIFVGGSALLSISISLNALSDHGACTAVFVAVAAIIGLIFSSIQTLGRISWLAWVGAACIITAVFILTIAVGIQGHAPMTDGVIPAPDYKLFGNPTFVEAMTALSTISLTYAGTPAFFNIVSEMRDPRHFTRALTICQVTVTVIYIVVGTVVYYYCGSHVASPALGSAGILIKKISYGFALPGLAVSATLMLHLPAKHIFIRILRGTRHLTGQTRTHWIVWLGSTFTVTSVAYIVASSIPVFSDLVSLVGALLATSLCFQPMGCMWLYDNWGPGRQKKSLRWCLMVAWCIFVILTGFFLTIGGTYSSIVSIISSYEKTGGSSAWSCANNDN
ncbi:amino acid transporter [Aspergillus fijiensis CBS 313.89]|uniref:Amino acid transporter n=1 Tax=Aspergillus fijiensis CBS 313.89 TaxID=1448319 RepID=A0A8G1S225_9EURO|nr:amino acid transporter [Aspergillus fijiensis CBS 313.89]RAK81970.1 amino acid transporter [Aspergillus fijiensis CBS 313.89]